MKFALTVTVLAAFGLTGCASLAPPQTSGLDREIDSVRMAAVEHAARLSGVQVLWINAPRKTALPSGS